VEAAVVAIHKYYDNIHANLRILEGIKPAEYVHAYNLDAVRLLKHRINGAYVVFASVGKWDPSVACLKDMEGAGSFVIEELFQDPQLQINGLMGVVDVSGFGFCHARQINYHEVKFLLKCVLVRRKRKFNQKKNSVTELWFCSCRKCFRFGSLESIS